MAQALLPILASFAFTAASTIITARADKKKTDKINEASKKTADLKKRQADAINAEKRNESNRNFRTLNADRASNQVGRGLNPESSYFSGGNSQQLKSSKIGADEYFQNVSGLGTQILSAQENEDRVISQSSLGLTGQLFNAGLGAAAKGVSAWKPDFGGEE